MKKSRIQQALYLVGGASIFFLWLQKPRLCHRKKVMPFTEMDYAHRGLYNEEFPENTKEALRRAVDAGYGIEMDVRPCKDGLVIHHDGDLVRSANRHELITDLEEDQLKDIEVFASKETIPTLDEALAIIQGKVPLLLEIKSEGRHFEAAAKVQEVMDQYQGPYLIESFQPLILLWYRLFRPQVLRGQLSERKIKGSPVRRWMMALLLVNVFSRPDFLAFEKKGSFWVKLWSKLGVPTFVYTLVHPSESKDYFHAGIFEHYLSTRRIK